MAREVADLARADLRRRGLDPSAYPRCSWEHSKARPGKLVAARVRGENTARYETYLDEVRRRPDAPLPVDERPEPPRRTLAVGGLGWPDAA